MENLEDFTISANLTFQVKALDKTQALRIVRDIVKNLYIKWNFVNAKIIGHDIE